jgi:transposase
MASSTFLVGKRVEIGFLVGRMIPEKVFQQILALGDAWRVGRMDYQEKEQRVLIRVEEQPALWQQESCPHCGGKTVRGYDHAPERRWRHLNVCQLQSEIVCALPPGECQRCRKIYTVRAPWEGRSRGLTQEFEAFALTLMREMPVKKAGEILGETDQKLWRALFAHVDAAWQDLSWENVIWVGADEMNRKKGHNYLTVFVDLQAKRVLLAVEGKDAGVWERFAEELGNHNGHPKAVTMVAIDMSPAYAKGVRENFGNGQIVFDKFHVVSQVIKAVDEVRRKEVRVDARSRPKSVKHILSVARESVSENQVLFRVSAQMSSRTMEVDLKMNKVGNEWKFDGIQKRTIIN